MDIQIFGERHSGTKFLQVTLNNFLEVSIVNKFGFKHFPILSNILKYKEEADKTLFICIVRNPYDWLAAMHRLPHHCAIKDKKDFNGFLFSEWISRNDKHEIIKEDSNIYNMRKFKNIFELRESKIQFLKYGLPLFVKNYIFIRYENFLNHYYIPYFIKKISTRFNIRQKNIIDSTNFKSLFFMGSQNFNRFINSQKKLDIINKNLNWNLENSIKYYPMLFLDNSKLSLNNDFYSKLAYKKCKNKYIELNLKQNKKTQT